MQIYRPGMGRMNSHPNSNLSNLTYELTAGSTSGTRHHPRRPQKRWRSAPRCLSRRRRRWGRAPWRTSRTSEREEGIMRANDDEPEATWSVNLLCNPCLSDCRHERVIGTRERGRGNPTDLRTYTERWEKSAVLGYTVVLMMSAWVDLNAKRARGTWNGWSVGFDLRILTGSRLSS